MVAAQSKTYSAATNPTPRNQRRLLGTPAVIVFDAFLQHAGVMLRGHIPRVGPMQTALAQLCAFISPAADLSKVK